LCGGGVASPLNLLTDVVPDSCPHTYCPIQFPDGWQYVSIQ